MEKIPNFFIVGAPKAGTTALYEYLSVHPAVFMPGNMKEPDYFSHEEILQQQLYYKTSHITEELQYKALFAGVKNQKAIGEASVSYLFYPKTAQNIYKFNPEAKIIIILREPVERAYSHYLMDLRLGLLNVELEEIVFRKLKHKFADMYYQQIVLLGKYAEQILRYLEVFKPTQIKILFYDHLKANPEDVMKSIFKFLGVDADFYVDTSQKHNAYVAPKNRLIAKMYQMHQIRSSISQLVPDSVKNSLRSSLFRESKKPKMSDEVRDFLTSYYKSDIEMVRQITGFEGW